MRQIEPLSYSPTPSAAVQRVLLFPAALFSLGAAVYLGVGVWEYFSDRPGDLFLRYMEGVYFLRRNDPLDVRESYGYPPWSYAFGQLFVPAAVSFEYVKSWFFVLSCAAWLGLAANGFTAAQRLGASYRIRILFGAASVCFFAVTLVLRLGNFGLIVTALLVAAFLFLERNRTISAGVCFALALIKPQTAALFLFIPALRGQWRTIAVTVILVVSGWFAAALWAQKSPMRMLTEFFSRGAAHEGPYQGLLGSLKVEGISAQCQTLSGMIFGAVIVSILCYRYRRLSDIRLAAIPAVVSSIWMYQQPHDLVLFHFFALLALSYLYQCADAISRREMIPIVGLVWFPYFSRFDSDPLLSNGLRIVWFLVLLLLLERLRKMAEGEGGARSTL